MGITHIDTLTANDQETTFSSRARLSISMSGESDNGLSFGASFRADNAGTAAGGTAGTVFISGSGATLSMGDITAANEAATGDVAGVGYAGAQGKDTDTSTTLVSRNEFGYLASAAEGVAFSYAIDGLSLHLSTSQRDAVAANETDAFGATYKFGDYTFGVGYAEKGASEQTSISARGAVAGVNFAVVHLDNNRPATVAATDVDSETGLSIAYTMDALTLTAFTREVDYFAAATQDRNFTGVGASYNLGGGARIVAGFVDGAGPRKQDNAYDIGMTFSF